MLRDPLSRNRFELIVKTDYNKSLANMEKMKQSEQDKVAEKLIHEVIKNT
jgi:hypothetical protein